ncbi:MAG TPA: cupin domain-containing protein, partial [Gemmatimonadales bacterium]|nr:cupin domain-containing protein [Gemmatimonadales bacterium]
TTTTGLARFGVMVLGAAVAGCHAATARGSGGDAVVRPVIEHELPPMDGARLRTTVVEVAYGPGGASPPHSHPCPVIGYVLEGALRSQVAGEPERVYRAGESFYEAPNGTHRVSANASDREPVRFLAFFTCDSAGPLTAPARP